MFFVVIIGDIRSVVTEGGVRSGVSLSRLVNSLSEKEIVCYSYVDVGRLFLLYSLVRRD